MSLFYRGRANLKPAVWTQSPSAAVAEGKQACGLDSEQAAECDYSTETLIHP